MKARKPLSIERNFLRIYAIVAFSGAAIIAAARFYSDAPAQRDLGFIVGLVYLIPGAIGALYYLRKTARAKEIIDSSHRFFQWSYDFSDYQKHADKTPDPTKISPSLYVRIPRKMMESNIRHWIFLIGVFVCFVVIELSFVMKTAQALPIEIIFVIFFKNAILTVFFVILFASITRSRSTRFTFDVIASVRGIYATNFLFGLRRERILYAGIEEGDEPRLLVAFGNPREAEVDRGLANAMKLPIKNLEEAARFVDYIGKRK